MRSKPRILPRPATLLSRLALLTLLAGSAAGCANRGMNPGAGTGGDAGVTGSGGAGSGGMGSGGMGSGGMGSGGMGSGGAIDLAPSPVDATDVGGSADVRDATDARDASAEHVCTPAADFTFETVTTNMEHVSPGTNAVKSVAHSVVNRYCGARALELTTMFAADVTKGEVLIDVPAALQNLAGKTITIHVAAIPPPDEQTYVAVTLVTAGGYLTLPPSIRSLTADWLTQEYMIAAASDAGVMQVTSIAIQVFDLKSYVGKVYVDDLDIR